jgi:hypothetical protein
MKELEHAAQGRDCLGRSPRTPHARFLGGRAGGVFGSSSRAFGDSSEISNTSGGRELRAPIDTNVAPQEAAEKDVDHGPTLSHVRGRPMLEKGVGPKSRPFPRRVFGRGGGIVIRPVRPQEATGRDETRGAISGPSIPWRASLHLGVGRAPGTGASSRPRLRPLWRH